jgi:sugar lactone lactonase YvrE
MKRTYPLLATAFLAALPTVSHARPPVPVSHPAPGNRLVWDSRKFMRVSELRPGMRGYALTVFKGTKIEKFHVEILGVISKFNMGKDYILFRALDGPSVTRQLNIAHGMSGSPIYIDGRLVGAISMGIPGTQFPKDPIALATPIEDMFDAWSPDLPSHVGSVSASPDTTAGDTLSAAGVKASAFSQIDIPVTVSGVNHAGLDWLSQRFSRYHFDVTAGGGAGSGDDNPLARNPTLVPGSAVGVSLVQGDIDVTATGTVTYRDGNRLLLFGHPLADLGPIDAALTTAYVVDIFPSYQDSIKLGAPIKTVGRIFQDRPFSVGGIIGSMPSMIPVTVDVQDDSIKRRKVTHARVINHPLLTEQLITMVADQAIAQLHGEPGDSEAVVTMDADVEELGHIHRTNTFFDPQAIDQSAIGDLVSLLHLLNANPFYPLSMKSLKMSVRVQTRHDTAEIDRIYVKQGRYAPGDTVDVGVVLKPFKRDYVTRHIAVKIPANAPEGTFTIAVRGGGTDSAGLGGGGGIIIIRSNEPAGTPAATVQQLAKRFLEHPRNTELQVQLVLPTRAIDIRGEKLSNVPPNIAAALQSSHTTGLVTERDEVKVNQDTPYIVTGSQMLSVTVQQRDQATPGQTAPSAPAPAPAASSDEAGSDSASSGARPQGQPRMAMDAESSLHLASEIDTPSFSMDNSQAPTEYLDVTGVPKPQLPAGKGKASAATTPTAAPAPSTSPAAPGATPPAPADAAWKPVAHPASVWRQSKPADFASGVLTGLAISSTGDVAPSPSIKKYQDLDGGYAWSLATAPDGAVYVGTGDRGVIYRVAPHGRVSKFFQTDDLEVTALTIDAAGNVYAGGLPHGVVYRITPDGHGRVFYTAAEPYVTALAYDNSHDRLFVGTGGGTGKVYAVSSTGVASPWLSTGEAHILSLAVDAAGTLYAGTASNGLVYQVSPTGVSRMFYDSPDSEVTGLAVAGDKLYVATAPHGNVYRLDQNAKAKVLSERPVDSLSALLAAPDGNIYAAANGILRIAPDDTILTQTTPTDTQFLSLGWNPRTSALLAGTGTVASLYTLGAQADTATAPRYVSPVFDAGDVARWGAITWNTDIQGSNALTVSTRSGDTPHPDSSWSPWSAPYSISTGQQIASPPGRYLQYEAEFPTTAPGGVLRDVAAYYRPRNHAPAIKVIAPQDGDALSKTVTLQWNAIDPDRDVLSYDIAISSDGGKTWKPLRTHYRPATPASGTPPAPARTVTDAEVQARVAQLKKEMDQHPTDFPPAVRAQILAQAPAVARATLYATPAPGTSVTTTTTTTVSPTGHTTTTTTGKTRDTTFQWDTTDTPDGTYQLRITATDHPSNPDDPLTASSTVSPVIVSNHAPAVTASVKSKAGDGRVTLQGVASGSGVFVKSVQFRVDGGDVYAASPDSGLFDTLSTAFTIVTAPLTTGDHKIEIQAVDRAGNITTTTVPVTIP